MTDPATPDPEATPAPDAPGGSVSVPLKQAAYANFQQALLSGRLRAGQFVSQRDLVALLGLSIGALRELLPRLVAEGLLTVLPQRGIQITAIDLPTIRDAFQMRMALEREAVMCAVRAMPDEDLAREAARHEAMLARLASDQAPDFFVQCQAIDTDFHAGLVAATGNELLAQAYGVIAVRIRLIRRDRITLSPASLPEAFADHLRVIEAIRARDMHAAIEAIDAHIMHARSRAMQL
jgi:DNA-binding GntR family transcriptional regulator